MRSKSSFKKFITDKFLVLMNVAGKASWDLANTGKIFGLDHRMKKQANQ